MDAADAEEHGLIVRAVIAGKDGALVKQWAAWAAKEVSNYFGPTPVEAPPRAHACTTCRHLTKPGRSDGNCAERLDLPFTYSPGHPLHDLPTDGGASCTEWSPT